MEVNVRYLQADPKTGVLRYRRAFPAELRPFVSENGRPLTELKVSLGARSLDQPGAKARHDEAAARFDRMVARARKLAAGAYDRLDPPLIKYLADRYLHHQLELDDAARWRQPLPAYQFDTRRDREADYEESRELLEDFDLDGLVAYWGEWAQAFSNSLGYTFDPRTPAFANLCRALGEAACQLWLAIDRRNDGFDAETPKEPKRPVPSADGDLGDTGDHATTATHGRSFEEIALGIINNPAVATLGEGVREHVRTALRFLREVHGSLRPAQVTRAAITELLDLMAQRPTKLRGADRALSLPELAERYRDRPEVPRMSGRTQEVRMMAMSTTWKLAASRGDIPASLENPFTGRSFAKTPASAKKAKGFTAAEIRAYFSMPAFQKADRPARGRGETIYWLPLIALYTGARPEEVAQLLVADIFQRPRDGRWVIRFTDEGVHPVKGRQSLKTERSESGRRTFPVPQPLLDLGLIDYRSHLEGQEELALFPLLTRKNRRPGIYDSFGSWFVSYVYDHGVLDRDHGRKPVREFRHTWTTAARASGIYREAQEYIQGHKAPGGSSSNEDYGHDNVLADQIDKLQIVDMHGEEVDLVQIVPRWNPPTT